MTIRVRARALAVAAAVVAFAVPATTAAAPKHGTGGVAAEATTLTVYSGRDERFVKPMFDLFTQRTGIQLQVRYGDSASLAATLLEEGTNSPADVYIAQDAGALGAVGSAKRLAVLPQRTLKKVAPRFRAPGHRWVGVSGRARVVAYNTDAVRASDLPTSVWGYTSPRWRGKIAVPPTNASFIAFVSAMRLRAGDDRTRDWLLALKANDAKFFPSNGSILQALARREVEVGFVNHYYLYQLKESTPSAPVANHFLSGRDPGALINVAGAGVVASSKKKAAAVRLIDFLLGRDAQRFFARSPGRAEYPLAAGIRPRVGLPPLTRIEGAKINLSALGAKLPSTLELLREVGYTR
ncbi:MAG TPA: iron ABC transporter substrate-binding protein [Gaiellaceae bacterium]|nr:iron ABC transporter substrate-binding protein [Gaiellaceae bacterium]